VSAHRKPVPSTLPAAILWLGVIVVALVTAILLLILTMPAIGN